MAFKASDVPQAFADQLDELIVAVPKGKLRDKICVFAKRALGRAQRGAYASGDDFQADAERQLKGIDPATIAALIAALAPLIQMIIAGKGG